MTEEKKKKAVCPFCGHPVNVFYRPDAACQGVYLKCKNKICGRIFELRITPSQD